MENKTKLEYKSEGRAGTVIFKNEKTRFEMWWEFAGGDAIAIVAIPMEDEWEQYTQLPLSERMQTLKFIGEQIVEDKLSGSGSFIIGQNMITFYKSA